ncbi:hypothetical protein QMU90_002312 [Edwardsiella ictaluri]|nr:hypothetical protein [Edwardsiella ictaluri]
MNISDIFTSTLYSNGLSTISAFVSFVAVPASGYLSYRFAIKGKRRDEWNALADPMRKKLRVQIDAIKHGDYRQADISRSDIIQFSDLLTQSDGDNLIAAFDDFESEHTSEKLFNVGPGRRRVIGDTSKALAASIKLLSLIPRK